MEAPRYAFLSRLKWLSVSIGEEKGRMTDELEIG
jgi:hypothetical protein